MIIEMREYSVRMGAMSEFVEAYRSKGLPIQLRHLRSPVGFFLAETGSAPRFVHIWRYASQAEREQQRAELHEDPDWSDYVTVSHTFILDMEIRILNVLDFGPEPLLRP
jgi:hypothetical protein